MFLVTINVKQLTDLLICNTVYTYFDRNNRKFKFCKQKQFTKVTTKVSPKKSPKRSLQSLQNIQIGNKMTLYSVKHLTLMIVNHMLYNYKSVMFAKTYSQ